MQLSRRDMVSVQRIAAMHARRSPEFLRGALVEVGASLAESAIPVSYYDETAFIELIVDHSSRGRVLRKYSRCVDDKRGRYLANRSGG